MRGLTIFIVLLAGVGSLVGFLFSHSAVGAGWGMCIAGALASFVVGGSGSPSDNLVRGRMGAFGTYWGQSAPLPQSPIWMLFASLLVFGGGIGLIVLGYS
jgi:hypothetical protein